MISKGYPLITCSLEENTNIVTTKIRNVLNLDLEAAKQLVASRLDFMKDEKHYVLIDISDIKHFTPEAKQYMQSPEAGLKNILGAAFIASNPISILIATIFIKAKIHFPAKFFSKKDEALKWIKELRIKNIEL